MCHNRFSASSSVLIATIELILAVGALASSGTSGRTAFVGESSRRGTVRRMLAMPISGGFGASRLSGYETGCSQRFELNHLLFTNTCCRFTWYCNIGNLKRRKDS